MDIIILESSNEVELINENKKIGNDGAMRRITAHNLKSAEILNIIDNCIKFNDYILTGDYINVLMLSQKLTDEELYRLDNICYLLLSIFLSDDENIEQKNKIGLFIHNLIKYLLVNSNSFCLNLSIKTLYSILLNKFDGSYLSDFKSNTKSFNKYYTTVCEITKYLKKNDDISNVKFIMDKIEDYYKTTIASDIRIFFFLNLLDFVSGVNCILYLYETHSIEKFVKYNLHGSHFIHMIILKWIVKVKRHIHKFPDNKETETYKKIEFNSIYSRNDVWKIIKLRLGNELKEKLSPDYDIFSITTKKLDEVLAGVFVYYLNHSDLIFLINRLHQYANTKNKITNNTLDIYSNILLQICKKIVEYYSIKHTVGNLYLGYVNVELQEVYKHLLDVVKIGIEIQSDSAKSDYLTCLSLLTYINPLKTLKYIDELLKEAIQSYIEAHKLLTIYQIICRISKSIILYKPSIINNFFQTLYFDQNNITKLYYISVICYSLSESIQLRYLSSVTSEFITTSEETKQNLNKLIAAYVVDEQKNQNSNNENLTADVDITNELHVIYDKNYNSTYLSNHYSDYVNNIMKERIMFHNQLESYVSILSGFLITNINVLASTNALDKFIILIQHFYYNIFKNNDANYFKSLYEALEQQYLNNNVIDEEHKNNLNILNQILFVLFSVHNKYFLKFMNKLKTKIKLLKESNNKTNHTLLYLLIKYFGKIIMNLEYNVTAYYYEHIINFISELLEWFIDNPKVEKQCIKLYSALIESIKNINYNFNFEHGSNTDTVNKWGITLYEHLITMNECYDSDSILDSNEKLYNISHNSNDSDITKTLTYNSRIEKRLNYKLQYDYSEFSFNKVATKMLQNNASKYVVNLLYSLLKLFNMCIDGSDNKAHELIKNYSRNCLQDQSQLLLFSSDQCVPIKLQELINTTNKPIRQLYSLYIGHELINCLNIGLPNNICLNCQFALVQDSDKSEENTTFDNDCAYCKELEELYIVVASKVLIQANSMYELFNNYSNVNNEQPNLTSNPYGDYDNIGKIFSLIAKLSIRMCTHIKRKTSIVYPLDNLSFLFTYVKHFYPWIQKKQNLYCHTTDFYKYMNHQAAKDLVLQLKQLYNLNITQNLIRYRYYYKTNFTNIDELHIKSFTMYKKVTSQKFYQKSTNNITAYVKYAIRYYVDPINIIFEYIQNFIELIGNIDLPSLKNALLLFNIIIDEVIKNTNIINSNNKSIEAHLNVIKHKLHTITSTSDHEELNDKNLDTLGINLEIKKIDAELKNKDLLSLMIYFFLLWMHKNTIAQDGNNKEHVNELMKIINTIVSSRIVISNLNLLYELCDSTNDFNAILTTLSLSVININENNLIYLAQKFEQYMNSSTIIVKSIATYGIILCIAISSNKFLMNDLCDKQNSKCKISIEPEILKTIITNIRYIYILENSKDTTASVLLNLLKINTSWPKLVATKHSNNFSIIFVNLLSVCFEYSIKTYNKLVFDSNIFDKLQTSNENFDKTNLSLTAMYLCGMLKYILNNNYIENYTDVLNLSQQILVDEKSKLLFNNAIWNDFIRYLYIGDNNLSHNTNSMELNEKELLYSEKRFNNIIDYVIEGTEENSITDVSINLQKIYIGFISLLLNDNGCNDRSLIKFFIENIFINMYRICEANSSLITSINDAIFRLVKNAYFNTHSHYSNTIIKFINSYIQWYCDAVLNKTNYTQFKYTLLLDEIVLNICISFPEVLRSDYNYLINSFELFRQLNKKNIPLEQLTFKSIFNCLNTLYQENRALNNINDNNMKALLSNISILSKNLSLTIDTFLDIISIILWIPDFRSKNLTEHEFIDTLKKTNISNQNQIYILEIIQCFLTQNTHIYNNIEETKKVFSSKHKSVINFVLLCFDEVQLSSKLILFYKVILTVFNNYTIIKMLIEANNFIIDTALIYVINNKLHVPFYLMPILKRYINYPDKYKSTKQKCIQYLFSIYQDRINTIFNDNFRNLLAQQKGYPTYIS